MPRYAPLPRVELDPRSEVELVKAAARRVYEASSSTLNDFSSGSPIMALLEGQSFAQAEFLQFANQFPESVLVEWIGPFLGAQRRTGAGAQVDVTFSIEGRDEAFEIYAGYQLGTDPNKTGGESIKFVTLEQLSIPKGSIEGTVRAIALETGTKGNVQSNTISRTLTSLAGVRSVTNKEAAFGGQNAELLTEVKERFFSLIRRRNPVSSEDWIDWFSDALGAGTTVSVLPRHSEKGIYEYETNYIRSNPSVAFFVLNPDGTPITPTQRDALETLMKWSLPIEFMGYIYPMEVNDVDFNITFEYNPARSYAQNLEKLSSSLRSNLFSVMTPNAVFPIDYNASVLDVQNGLTATFPITLGVDNRFTDPNVVDIVAYHSPTNIGTETFSGISPLLFETGSRLKEGDLVIEYASGEPYYYPVLTDFDPDNNDKRQYVNEGLLELKIIKELVAGRYEQGEVISFPGTNELHVVLQPFLFTTRDVASTLVDNGFLSEAKNFVGFNSGAEYYDDSGNYNPDIIAFETTDIDTTVYTPQEPSDVELQKRVGYPVYVVKSAAFFPTASTSTLGNAQAAGLVSTQYRQVELLTDGSIYSQNAFIKTPNLTELLSNQLNADSCYLIEAEGLKESFFRVEKQFGFFLTEEEVGYTAKVEQLILEGFIKPVQTTVFVVCSKLVYADKPFRYSARFKMGEYLRFREKGGYDSDALEACFETADTCDNVTPACSELIEAQLPLPRYFQALRDFTPTSSDVDVLIDKGYMIEVDSSYFRTTYSLYLDFYTPVLTTNITNALISEGIVSSQDDIVNGHTVAISTPTGVDRGVYVFENSTWTQIMEKMTTYRDLFRFAPGDVVTLRQDSTTKSYRALDHFTPMLSPEVYIKNGILTPNEITTSTVSWIDPTYHMEDVVYSINRGAISFYRVVLPSTPNEEEDIWNDLTSVNTPRIEELKGSLQKIVVQASCNQNILSRLMNKASSVKLGVANFSFRSKDSFAQGDQYVWESIDDARESSALSYSPTITGWDYEPVDYGNGTLAL